MANGVKMNPEYPTITESDALYARDGLVHTGNLLRMLNWALMFLLVALLAAILGFSGVAVAAAGIAKLLFVLFLVLFLASLVIGLVNRARP